jgi:hypothetical protein
VLCYNIRNTLKVFRKKKIPLGKHAYKLDDKVEMYLRETVCEAVN